MFDKYSQFNVIYLNNKQIFENLTVENSYISQLLPLYHHDHLTKIFLQKHTHPLTRLGLSDDIMSLDAWNDGPLLDGRWLLKTIGVDSSQELLAQFHVIKVLRHFIPIALLYFMGCFKFI